MKCIKCIKVAKGYELDEVRRINDIDAEQKVKSGNFKYIPKTEWKGSKGSVKVEVAEGENEQPAETTIAEKQLKSKKKKDDKAK